MIEEPKQPEAPVAPVELLPICPYCESDQPAVIAARGPIVVGGFQVVIIFCGKCRKIWNTQITGSASRIVLPPN